MASPDAPHAGAFGASPAPRPLLPIKTSSSRFCVYTTRSRTRTRGPCARKTAISAAQGLAAVVASIAPPVWPMCIPCSATAASCAATNVCTCIPGPTQPVRPQHPSQGPRCCWRRTHHPRRRRLHPPSHGPRLRQPERRPNAPFVARRHVRSAFAAKPAATSASCLPGAACWRRGVKRIPTTAPRRAMWQGFST